VVHLLSRRTCAFIKRPAADEPRTARYFPNGRGGGGGGQEKEEKGKNNEEEGVLNMH